MTLFDPTTPPGWAGVLRGAPCPGASAERTRTVTTGDIQRFAEMTGDRNPLHFDEGLARASRFGRIIVQGGVTSGLLNATVAEDLPGPGTVFLETAWKFLQAVGPGERITARVEVLTRRDDKPICTLACQIRNAAGETCLSGTATTYTVPLLAPGSGGMRHQARRA